MKQLFIILLIIKCLMGEPRVDPLVSTTRGLLRGLQAEDGDYDMFLGIPYAVVDENNPFGPASPHPGFTTTFEAHNDGVHCAQKIGNIFSGTVQCLELNVYVPRTASSAHKLPVIVYIHGGAFVRNHKGMSNLSPKFLIRHDVIIVTFNYRLGPYGFLCVSEPGFSNQGLKDQLLAIQWVKENIEAFGGDANELTFMAQSAGAMSLDIHMYTNERLGKRAILQSANALNIGWISTQNDSVPIMIAEELGFSGEGVKEAIDYLSGLDPLEVVKMAESYTADNDPITRACVETNGDDAVLTDFPENLKPKVKGMDIMIGHANKEIMFIYPNSDEDFYNNYDFSKELIGGFDAAYDEDVVRNFYIGDDNVGDHLQDAILDYGSDLIFVHPTERTIDRYLEAGANAVYRFVFSYEGGRNRNKYRMNLTSAGASHGDDQGYLFEMDIFKNHEINDEDQRVIDVMTKMWTNFAKYGDPTPSASDMIPEKWQAVDASRRAYLNIAAPVTVGSRPFHNRMAFWDLYYKIHGDHVLGYRP